MKCRTLNERQFLTMPERIILTDCDGVLCEWDLGFDKFAQSRELVMLPDALRHYSIADRYGITYDVANSLVNEFNHSDRIANLTPLADAQEYVKRLTLLGFKFIVITALSDSPVAKIYRTSNLTNLFGDAISEIHCIKMNESKYHALQRWAGSGLFWIEDHMRQAEAGYEQGLNTILVSKPYNMHYDTNLFPRVSQETPWAEIYKKVTEAYNL